MTVGAKLAVKEVESFQVIIYTGVELYGGREGGRGRGDRENKIMRSNVYRADIVHITVVVRVGSSSRLKTFLTEGHPTQMRCSSSLPQ